jgi:hypothetical protein
VWLTVNHHIHLFDIHSVAHQQLDPIILPSTPPLPALGPDSQSPDTTYHPTPHGLTGYSDPGAFGLKGDVWLSEPIFSSPPSPSNIDPSLDQQTGGYFPQSDSSGSDDLATANSASSEHRPGHQTRRHNLSLSIPSYPTYQPSQASPSTLASSGAPFTDSSSIQNLNPSLDYFHLDEASLPSAGDQQPDTIPPQVLQSNTYRLPASQPSSPVRGVYPPGQVPFLTAGRARGATFSGGSGTWDFGQYPQVASAVPAHFAFANIQSNSNSPLSASPLLGASTGQEFFGAPAEDVTTPLAQHRAPATSTQPTPDPALDMPLELADKLTLLDK